MIHLAAIAAAAIAVLAAIVAVIFLKAKREVNWKVEYGPDSWALVTGSTDGIGKEIARQLGQRGFNLVLMARNEAKLKKTRKEILSSFEKGAIKIKTVVFDFSSSSKDELVDSLSGLDRISLLVNNVGVSHQHPKFFSEEDMDSLDSIMNVNIINTVRLTKIVLEDMLSLKESGRKASIVNMGSFSGECPIPLLQTYSASKAFLKTWSIALGKELESQGITCHLFNTYFVVSNMSKIKRPSMLVPTAKDYVTHLLRKVGRPGLFFSTPYPAHYILSSVMSLIPSYILLSINNSTMLTTRSKALRRQKSKND